MNDTAAASTATTGGRAPPFGAWERMLAGRYLRAKRSQGGVALISIISFTGIMVAVAVLIVVMSVMNGFRAELLNKILGFNGHIFVTGGVLDGPARDPTVQRILKVPGVTQAIPVIGFAQLTFVAAIIGTVMAVVMSHRARRPRHTFVASTIALTALSIVPDVTADAHTATKFVLALTHVVAASIVIPALASRLTD